VVNSSQLSTIQEFWQTGGNLISGVVKSSGELYQAYKPALTNISLLVVAGVTGYIAIGLMEVINRIPLAETTLQAIGIICSTIFAARKLWTTSSRQQTWEQLREYKERVFGSPVEINPVATNISTAAMVKSLESSDPSESSVATPTPDTQHPTPDSSNRVDELRYFFLASQVELVDDASKITSLKHHTTGEGIGIGVAQADGEKCDRCWNYSPTVGTNSEHSLLCDRCVDALAGEF
jgi:isoleucyl-tRNA synthetase